MLNLLYHEKKTSILIYTLYFIYIRSSDSINRQQKDDLPLVSKKKHEDMHGRQCLKIYCTDEEDCQFPDENPSMPSVLTFLVKNISVYYTGENFSRFRFN